MFHHHCMGLLIQTLMVGRIIRLLTRGDEKRSSAYEAQNAQVIAGWWLIRLKAVSKLQNDNE